MHAAEDSLRAPQNDDFSAERGYFRNFPPPFFDKNGSPLWSPTGPPIPLQTSTFPSIFRSCLHIVTFFQFSSENKFKSGDKKLNDVIFRRQRFQAAKSGTDGAPFSQYFCRWIRLPGIFHISLFVLMSDCIYLGFKCYENGIDNLQHVQI